MCVVNLLTKSCTRAFLEDFLPHLCLEIRQTMSGNVNYLKTPVGKVKGLGVGLGLIGMAFLASAYERGDYYGQEDLDDGGTIWLEVLECEADEERQQEKKMCPMSVMVILPMYLVALTWTSTFFFLIWWVWKERRPQRVHGMDFWYHLVTGVVFLVSGLLITGFLIMLRFSHYYHDWEAQRVELIFQYPRLIIAVGVFYFKLFLIPAGVFYILAGVLVNRQAAHATVMGSSKIQIHPEPQVFSYQPDDDHHPVEPLLTPPEVEGELQRRPSKHHHHHHHSKNKK